MGRDFRIGVLEGDDIGPEVVAEAVKVLRAAAAATGLTLDFLPLPIGRAGHAASGDSFPPDTAMALRGLEAWLYGPIGHGGYPKHLPGWRLPPVRKTYDLYASIKPIRSHPALPSLHPDIDLVVIREVSEGLQSAGIVLGGAGEFRPNDDISIGARVITRKGSARVARAAFELARTRPKRKVTAVHKATVYTLTCGMFAEECRKMAALYPDVAFEEMLVDTAAMRLVMAPQPFDVIVTTNQFGDILTDLTAGLIGGLGLAPGLCAGTDQAMAQATHGSAPDIAGQDRANPIAMILSAGLLMDWLGRRHDASEALRAAALIQAAVEAVITEGEALTPDLGGSAGTAALGSAIAAKIAALGA